MAVYLNTNSPLEKFEFLLNSKYYVDKSNIIEKYYKAKKVWKIINNKYARGLLY